MHIQYIYEYVRLGKLIVLERQVLMYLHMPSAGVCPGRPMLNSKITLLARLFVELGWIIKWIGFAHLYVTDRNDRLQMLSGCHDDRQNIAT